MCYLPQEPVHIDVLQQLFVVVVSIGHNKLHALEVVTSYPSNSDNSKAAKWEQYERDGDRYYLQYRTVEIVMSASMYYRRLL